MVVPEFRRVVRIVCVVTALEVRVSTPPPHLWPWSGNSLTATTPDQPTRTNRSKASKKPEMQTNASIETKRR